MMKQFRNLIGLVLASALFGCGGSDTPLDLGGGDGGGEEVAQTSHNAGMDCMECHTTGGTADAFTLAGTVYRSSNVPQTDATVTLYIANTNTISAQLDTDDSGNFYTSDPVDGLFTGDGLVSGCDAEVQGPSGNRRTMPGVVSNGSCNSCHGVSTGIITAN